MDHPKFASLPRFHLAFPVKNLTETKSFYQDKLGCRVGRESQTWIDFDFFGHQITAHLSHQVNGSTATNEVDGDHVPIRHFGVILEWGHWHELVAKLRAESISFVIEPHVRFQGKIGEQATLFFQDPSGNTLELKSFKDPSQVFEK
jgi:extradiol dioxygenase family protein